MNNNTCINCIHKEVCYRYRIAYVCAREGTCADYIPNRTKGEWKVKGIGINTQNPNICKERYTFYALRT